MANISFVNAIHGWLGRLRRRAWVAIGICLLGQIGNAAFNANLSGSQALAANSRSETCPVTSPGIPFIQSDYKSGNII